MDTFSLYDELPLFSGDLLVGWSPLADELPSMVQDELQQDQQMYTTSSFDDTLVKGSLIQVPIQDVKENVLESALVDTRVNLVDLLKQENISQPSLSPQITRLNTPEIIHQETRAEDLLQNVSEALMANLSSGAFINERNSTDGQLDLSSLECLCGESGMLGDDEVDSILSGGIDEVDNFFNNSSDVLAADILSPVSPEDVDRILSSSPVSSYDENALSPSSSTVYSSSVASPCSVNTSFDTDPSAIDTSDSASTITISMRYLREELLKPTPALSIPDEERPKKIEARRKSRRPAVKYEPYSPPPFEKYQKGSSSQGKVELRPVEQRKQRKKQQNKDAALRYRLKKRDEKMTFKQECDQLEEKNSSLRDKADSMTREIQYLKDLLAEVYKAKAASTKKPCK